MRVKSVEREYLGGDVSRYNIYFEHNDISWWKICFLPLTEDKLKNLLNSVIEDTITRTR